MTDRVAGSKDPSSLLLNHTSRRHALKTLGGLGGVLLTGQFGLGCGSDDSSTDPGSGTPGDPLVLLVPGFMTQIYKAFSIHGESVINAQLNRIARAVPVLGERIAAALPTIELPLQEGGFISFASLMAHYDAEGIDYVDMSVQSGFDTQMGVVDNGQVIAAYLGGLKDKRVTIISHSKGGLDTLHALLENRGLWNTTVTGWVALQSPFHGSAVADNVPDGLAGPLLTAFGGDQRSLLELKAAVRQQYMSSMADAISELTRAVPVLTCHSSFTTSPSQGIESTATEFAQAVFNSEMLQQIAAIVEANPLDPARATVEAIEAISARANQLAVDVMSEVPLMGLSNLMMQEANDGLVAVSSTILSGATVNELAPETDHAAPAMDVAPFKNFWTAEYRNLVTAGLVESVREKAARLA